MITESAAQCFEGVLFTSTQLHIVSLRRNFATSAKDAVDTRPRDAPSFRYNFSFDGRRVFFIDEREATTEAPLFDSARAIPLEAAKVEISRFLFDSFLPGDTSHELSVRRPFPHRHGYAPTMRRVLVA